MRVIIHLTSEKRTSYPRFVIILLGLSPARHASPLLPLPLSSTSPTQSQISCLSALRSPPTLRMHTDVKLRLIYQ